MRKYEIKSKEEEKICCQRIVLNESELQTKTCDFDCIICFHNKLFTKRYQEAFHALDIGDDAIYIFGDLICSIRSRMASLSTSLFSLY